MLFPMLRAPQSPFPIWLLHSPRKTGTSVREGETPSGACPVNERYRCRGCGYGRVSDLEWSALALLASSPFLYLPSREPTSSFGGGSLCPLSHCTGALPLGL